MTSECNLQQDDFLVVRLVLEEGISQDYFDNDMVLLSKDDPNVSAPALEPGIQKLQFTSSQILTPMNNDQGKNLCRHMRLSKTRHSC